MPRQSPGQPHEFYFRAGQVSPVDIVGFFLVGSPSCYPPSGPKPRWAPGCSAASRTRSGRPGRAPQTAPSKRLQGKVRGQRRGLHRVHGRQAYRPLLIRDFGCAGLTGIGPVRQRTWYSRLGLLSSELHGRGLLIPSTGIVVVAETMGHERLAMTANGSSQPGACWMRRAGTPVELRLERIAVQSGWARHGGHLAGQAPGQSSSRLSTRARPRRP